MRPELTNHDRAILGVLHKSVGYTIEDAAHSVYFRFGSGARQHSAYVRQRLLDLERRGLVARLDDEKPVCWVLAAKGAEIGKEGV